MNEDIVPNRVLEAAEAGFGPQLARKEKARRLAKDSGAPPVVAESVFGRLRSEGIGNPSREARDRLAEKAISPGEEKTVEAEIQMSGEGEIIDRIRVDPDAREDAYVAEFEQLPIRARVSEEMARRHPRAFQDGFYAEIGLSHESGSSGPPFEVTGLRPLQESSGQILEGLACGREPFSPEDWAYFLVQSVGLDPFAKALSAGWPRPDRNGQSAGGTSERSLGRWGKARAISLLLLRLVPLVERNYNLVELGPRQTGKSYLYEKFAPRAHLLSGGKASVSKLFVDTRGGEKGLVAGRDVVAFDEISSTDFQGDEVVSALKTYMESGQVSRGKMKVRGRASIALLGNIDQSPVDLLEETHLFEPFPGRIREDTALMDRVHAYLPGWEVPKIGPDSLAEGLGLTASYLAECLSRLRDQSLTALIEEKTSLEGNLEKRDRDAALKTASGLLKLIYPGLAVPRSDRTIEEVPQAILRWALWMGLEMRLRVRQQQHRLQPGEFETGDFRFTIDPAYKERATGAERTEEWVLLPEEQSG